MRPNRVTLVSVVLVLSVGASACGQEPVEAGGADPVTVEEVDGSELKRLTLTEPAATRLGIELAAVSETADGQLSVPYAAILYDPSGTTWAYVAVDDLVFVREELVVDHIDGDVAILVAGPAVGARVVTLGAAELYGAETGVGGGH